VDETDAVVEAIVIATAADAVAAVRVAVQEAATVVTVVATVAADAEEGKSSNQLPVIWRAAGMRPFFLCLETMAS